MKTGSKLLALLLAFALAFGMALPAAAAERGDIVVLYTNDVHTYIDRDLTYSLVSAYRDTLDNVLLVDAGDHIQGTAYGGMDSGETIIELMNAARYDVATLGNHEFDYGMDGCLNTVGRAEFSYVSCNAGEADLVIGLGHLGDDASARPWTSEDVIANTTGLGDLNADAFYWYCNEVAGLDCDLAVMNGGGITANVPAGQWSYRTSKTVKGEYAP